jgi:hypothetical protein
MALAVAEVREVLAQTEQRQQKAVAMVDRVSLPQLLALVLPVAVAVEEVLVEHQE